MLPEANRLNLAREFRYLKKEGRNLETVFFSLLYRRPKSSTSSPSRIGFVVSNRIGNAVVRNRIRRLLREVVQANLSALPNAFDIVIIAKKSSVGVSLEKLTAEYHKILPKLSPPSVS